MIEIKKLNKRYKRDTDERPNYLLEKVNLEKSCKA